MKTTRSRSRSIPHGYCQCGCGNKTTVSQVNNAGKGIRKGQPRKYLKGHFSKTQAYRDLYGSVDDRFWSKVNKTTNNRCWVWKGGTHHGYGSFKFRGKAMNAHRVSWIINYGDIPDSLDVCHDCPSGDNRLCVNPLHLFLGTRSENTKDLWNKGRGVPPTRPDNSGEKSHTAKMTEKLVRELRRRYKDGESVSSLAKDSGVTHINTWKAVTRRTWKHLK